MENFSITLATLLNFYISSHLTSNGSQLSLWENGVEYTQFLNMFSSEVGLVWKRSPKDRIAICYCSVIWTKDHLNVFQYVGCARKQ